MDFLNFVLRKKKVVELPKLENVRLENIGVIHHIEKCTDTFERIVAGKRIPDSERRAYNKSYEEDQIHLEPVDGVFSGSLGFIDFGEIRYSGRLESIYMAWMGIEPPYRKRGVGTKLVEEVEKTAIDRGANSTWGYVADWRFRRVFPFFEKLGYTVGNQMHSDFLISKNFKK